MRASTHISRKALTTLLHSPRTAAATGRPFNTVVCISTVALGIPAEQATQRFRRMRSQNFVRWSAYTPRRTQLKNGSPADTWQFEAPDGNHHVHWMLHVRPERRQDFERKLLRWVKRMAGLKPADALPNCAVHVNDLPHPEGKKLYMAKGADPFYAPLFRIRPVDCGVVYGVRGGTARSLGPSVWKPLKRAYKAGRASQQRLPS